MLALGWAVLEGIGAALVLPAMAALIAGNYEGPSRKIAYAIIGGVAGAGIAIGPIVGGWATTELSWRVVFVGEVVIVIGILVMTPFVTDALRSGPQAETGRRRRRPRRRWVSAPSCSPCSAPAPGDGSRPRTAPVEPFGFSPTLFLMAFGAVVLWGFVRWQRHREQIGKDPLVHLDLLSIPSLRAGLVGLFSQNLILMGDLLHDPALPAAGARTRCARDRREDAARCRS